MVPAFAIPPCLSIIPTPTSPYVSCSPRRSVPNAIFRLFKSRDSQQMPSQPESQTEPQKKVDSTSDMPLYLSPNVLSDRLTRPDLDIVLVLGASGLLGREVVKELLKQPGCIVLACIRSQSDATDSGLDQIALRIAQPRPHFRSGHRPSRLKFLVADLSTDVSYIAEEARRQCVGTVVFAASSGRNSKPGEIDNFAVRSLVKEMEPYLGTYGEARERILFDFQENVSQVLSAFRSIDDRVMGGASISRLVMSEDGKTARFQGNVTTANNGGFAQVRGGFDTDDMEQSIPIDLSSYAGIMIRCRGDGRHYKINLKDDEQPEMVFQASLGTVSGEWQTFRLPFSEFIPVRRGRIEYQDGLGPGIYASVLDTTKIFSLGIVVSKIEPGGSATPGFESGRFDLELSRITAFRASTPRFLLVSSAAVTRPFWSDEQKALAPRAAEIPIVRLNPSNILGHKLAGENAVRRGNIPWTIVRLTGLNDQVPSERKLILRQGDTLTGTLNRVDAARGVVSALRSTASTWKTFELGVDKSREKKENFLTDADFAALITDVLESQYGEETNRLV